MISSLAAQFAHIDALRAEWVRVNAEMARLEARRARILSERFDVLLEDAPPGSFHHDAGFRSMVADFAAAARVSSVTLEGDFCVADTLIHHLPETMRALSEGRIGARHASVIVSAFLPLSHAEPDAQADYERRVLDVAVEESPARTAAHAKTVAAAAAPQEVSARHRAARTTRAVLLTALDDGMAQLSAIVPEVLGRAVLDRLTGLARVVMAKDGTDTAGASHQVALFDGSAESASSGDGAALQDDRTLNNVRADILVDLLLAAHAETIDRTAEESIAATVQATISASTLAGRDEKLAEIDGYGPILPDVVRRLAGGTGSWNRLFLDPRGMAVSTDNYVPTAGMKRFLRARDQHCRFPGCRMPVHRCQIDHNHDHARGGHTEIGNLSHFCTRHHVFKHPDVDARYRWGARQLQGGVIEWTSPTGAVYIDKPPPRVLFV